MRVVVFAARSLGVSGLQTLIEQGFQVIKVYTEPPVEEAAEYFGSPANFCREKGIPFSAFSKDGLAKVSEEIKSGSPDVIFLFDFYSALSRSSPVLPGKAFTVCIFRCFPRTSTPGR